MNYEVRRTLIADLFASEEKEELFQLYSDESKGDYLPPVTTHNELYTNMEDMGIADLLCLYSGDNIVGFANLLTTVMPHYSENQTVFESIFVHPDHRKYGTGKMLVDAAEEIAREKGSIVLYITAPVDGRLSKVTGSYGFKETNRIYAKDLK